MEHTEQEMILTRDGVVSMISQRQSMTLAAAEEGLRMAEDELGAIVGDVTIKMADKYRAAAARRQRDGSLAGRMVDMDKFAESVVAYDEAAIRYEQARIAREKAVHEAVAKGELLIDVAKTAGVSNSTAHSISRRRADEDVKDRGDDYDYLEAVSKAAEEFSSAKEARVVAKRERDNHIREAVKNGLAVSAAAKRAGVTSPNIVHICKGA